MGGKRPECVGRETEAKLVPRAKKTKTPKTYPRRKKKNKNKSIKKNQHSF